MGYKEITFKNGFCIKSDCKNYYEDGCILCYQEDNYKGKHIYPYDTENNSYDVEQKCKFYEVGRCDFYNEEDEC